MIPTSPQSQRSQHSADESIRRQLNQLEAMLDEHSERLLDPEYYEQVGLALRALHARFRAHHAAGYVDHHGADLVIRPEFESDIARLRAEHTPIIGLLDRIIRTVESMADRSAEDKEVFALRCREAIATTRRHQAEEDRILFLSHWRDTGGES